VGTGQIIRFKMDLYKVFEKFDTKY